MDREYRKDNRSKREDTRNHRPRYGTPVSGKHTPKHAPKNKTESDRSRSPPQRERRDDRRRDRSPPRGPRAPPQRYDRDRDLARSRDRPASSTPPPSQPLPPHNRPGPRQPLDTRTNGIASKDAPPAKQQATADTKMAGAEDEDSEAEMARVMGFKGFRSTKNTKVPGNNKNYAVHKVKKSEYRQYMNRVGGFNRPLSPTRT